MKDLVIELKNISKLYQLGSSGLWPQTLRETLTNRVKQQFSQLKDQQPAKTIWALKDISAEIKRGQVIGIIGRNGAGKTTLLKILSQITRPTKGSAKIYGRTGSLLEVGTGFHQELTGRENIYFNGAVLGMRKKEIEGKFDQIVDFAGIEKFLDTPVKKYSSGMYVRLAFSVAAHLDAEILLVDEVLAVGDITFQKKCLDKMKSLTSTGRTVLFVSHNLAAINSLCSHALLIDQGQLKAIGKKEAVINKYMELVYKLSAADLSQRRDRRGNGKMRFITYWLEDAKGNKLTAFKSGQNVKIVAEYESGQKRKLKNVSVAFAITDHLGNPVTDLANRIAEDIWPEIPSAGVISCQIPRLPLTPGRYTFNLFAQVNGVLSDAMVNAGKFDVEAGDFYPSGKLIGEKHGPILIDHRWSFQSKKS